MVPFLFVMPDRFRPFIFFYRTCWAGKWGDQRVGRLGGRMVISLIRSQSCLRKFNVIHELMHILGFWHEQQREDRDQYVSINFQNVKQGLLHF